MLSGNLRQVRLVLVIERKSFFINEIGEFFAEESVDWLHGQKGSN